MEIHDLEYIQRLRLKVINEEMSHDKKEIEFLRQLEKRGHQRLDLEKAVLSVNNVTFTYPGTEIPVVQDVSFQLPKGSEVLALLGPSGSGKSTILRLIAGFEMPDSGTVTIGDNTVVSDHIFIPPDRRKVGYVFQSYALFPHLDVERNIEFGIKGTPREERQVRLEEILSVVELDGFRKRYPHELSGGQQQRVAIGRVLVTNPKLMLLDEPFSNLDEHLRHTVRSETLRIIKDRAIPTVLVTHDVHDVILTADRAIRIKDGKVLTLE